MCGELFSYHRLFSCIACAAVDVMWLIVYLIESLVCYCVSGFSDLLAADCSVILLLMFMMMMMIEYVIYESS